MTSVSDFQPRLDDRLTAEFHALSLALLPLPLRQDAALLDRSALRFTRLEPPRDPDLPLLPAKVYPRLPPALVEQAVRALVPPPPVSDFVGRKAELDRVLNALVSGRPVQITGGAGTGKTALLRQIAHDPRLRGHFRRIWWLDNLDRAGVTLGLALEAANVVIAPPAAQPHHMHDSLTASRTLLLIDSSAGVPDGAEWALGCTPHVVLVAAEIPASADSVAIHLTGLPPDVAANWLIGHAPVSGESAREISTLLDGRPAALRLAAALLAEDVITPEAMASTIEAVPVPEGEEDFAGERRLAALYALSFDALPESYQAVCRALAVANRWIAVETITAHFAKPLAGQRALRFLERRGFIERHVDKVRAVGAWGIAPAAEGAGLAIDLGTAPHVADLFDPNMPPDPQTAHADELHVRGVTLMNEGQDDAARSALEEALALRIGAGLKYAAAETQTALGRLAYLRGDDSIAIQRLEEAARHLHELHDDAALDVVRLALARAYRRAGRLDAALSVLGDEALAPDLAAVYRAREEWGKAEAVYRRWMTRAGEDPVAMADARIGLAETYVSAGRLSEALALVAEDETFAGRRLRAAIRCLQGDLQAAHDLFTRLEPETPPEWRAVVARMAARTMAGLGMIGEAAMLVGAEGIWYEANLPRPIFARQRASQALYAHLSLMLGNLEEAERAARAAHALVGERPDPESEAIVCRVLGRLAWKQGALQAAAHAFEAELAARNNQPHRDEHEIGIALHNLADVQRAMGEHERAIANYRRALSHKDPAPDTALTHLALAETLIEHGRAAEALETGARAIDMLTAHAGSDLQLLGYTMALQAQRQIEGGRAPRGAAVLDAWIQHMAHRLDEALHHPHQGVRTLAIGLYLRSEPPLDDPIPVIDYAERGLEIAEPNTWSAFAARRDLGLLYLRLGRWEDAREVLEPLLQQEAVPPFVLLAARLGLARAATHQRDLEVVAAHYEAGAELEPDTQARGLIYREAAEISCDLGDDPRAARYYAAALQWLDQKREMQTYADTVVALAYTRLRLRQFGEAIETFEAALYAVESMPRPDPALRSAVLLDMASAHHTLGQYRRAAETYRRSLPLQDAHRNPDRYLETLISLARSEAGAGEYQAAAAAYHDALQFEQLDSNRRRTLLAEQAEAFARLDQSQAAINAYDAALTIDGASARERAEIHRGIGAVYARLGSYDQARRHFEAVLSAVQDDRTGVTLKALADSHRALGQVKEAIDVYHRALGFLDRDAEPAARASTERALGEIYLERNQLSNAMKHLEAALDIERALPQHHGGHIVGILQGLALAHERRGELERATLRHHEALVYQDVRHAPERYVETLCTLGRLYTAQGRHGEAVRAYEEALRAERAQPEPDPARIDDGIYGLASARRAQGLLEAAAELYQQVAESPHRTPARSRALEALTDVTAEINRHLKTLEAAEQSLTMLRRASPPDLPGLIFVRAMLAQTNHALGRWEVADDHQKALFELLDERGSALRGDDLVTRMLIALRDGHDRESSGDWTAAQESYQAALEVVRGDARANAALVWVIQRKVTQTR
jgi:tetratricopeptide (TPR) repeat protein